MHFRLCRVRFSLGSRSRSHKPKQNIRFRRVPHSISNSILWGEWENWIYRQYSAKSMLLMSGETVLGHVNCTKWAACCCWLGYPTLKWNGDTQITASHIRPSVSKASKLWNSLCTNTDYEFLFWMHQHLYTMELLKYFENLDFDENSLWITLDISNKYPTWYEKFRFNRKHLEHSDLHSKNIQKKIVKAKFWKHCL